MTAAVGNPGMASLAERKRQTREDMFTKRAHLLQKMPFLGALMMRLELVATHDCRLPTAATNGDKIYVDIDFYRALADEERLFVLAHEAWHCALMHFARRQNRDRDLFNVATDLEIHFLLTREKLKAPFVLPHEESWDGLSAEQIYAELEKQRGKPLGGGMESEHIGSTRQGGGFDKHLEKARERRLGEEGESDDALPQEPYFDPDYDPVITAASVERCRERVVAAMQQHRLMGRGTLPGELERLVGEILKPRIHWRELLAEFVTDCYGGSRQWLPPSRRHLGRGLYLQSMRGTRLHAAVAVDTSGSTTMYLPRFFAELTGLLNTFGSYEVTVFQCDAAICEGYPVTFSDLAPLPENHKWTARGGGGTDFRPVFRYLEEHAEPDLLVYLTDGYGLYPGHAPAYPVLWLVTPDGEIKAPWGMRCTFGDESSRS